MSCGVSQSTTDPKGWTEVFFRAKCHKGSQWSYWHRTGSVEPSSSLLLKGIKMTDGYRWIQMDYRPRLSQHSSPLVYPWFVTEFTCTNVDSPSVSCRIVDIGVAIRFLVAAGDRAASPRLVPAVGRPLVLADALLRDRSHRLRQAGRNAVPLNLCMCINK